DLPEHGFRVVEELACGRALLLVFEDLRITALQLPCLEERRPVDVAGEFLKVPVVEHTRAHERWLWRRVGFPVDAKCIGACAHERQALLLALGALMRFR